MGSACVLLNLQTALSRGEAGAIARPAALGPTSYHQRGQGASGAERNPAQTLDGDPLEHPTPGQRGWAVARRHRIWQKYGLQPHRVETFKFGTDPDFDRKLTDVVGLYLDDAGRNGAASQPNVYATDDYGTPVDSCDGRQVPSKVDAWTTSRAVAGGPAQSTEYIEGCALK